MPLSKCLLAKRNTIKTLRRRENDCPLPLSILTSDLGLSQGHTWNRVWSVPDTRLMCGPFEQEAKHTLFGPSPTLREHRIGCALIGQMLSSLRHKGMKLSGLVPWVMVLALQDSCNDRWNSVMRMRLKNITYVSHCGSLALMCLLAIL